ILPSESVQPMRNIADATAVAPATRRIDFMKLSTAVPTALIALLCGCNAPAPSVAASSQPALESAPTFSAHSDCGDWPQWGRDAAHEGNTCADGQRAADLLDDIVFDPFVPAEAADGDGLIVH